MNLMLVEILTCAVYLSSIFYIASGVTLVVCGYVLSRQEKYINIFEDYFLSVGNWAIHVGALTLLIAPNFGSLAVYKKNRLSLVLYAIFMFLLFIAQVSLGLFGGISINPQTKFYTDVAAKFEPFRRNDTGISKMLDKIQKDYSCCGLDGPDDYNTSSSVPDSCCASTNPCRDVYQSGCIQTYAKTFERKVKIIAYVAFVFSVPMPFCAWIAIALRQSLLEESELPTSTSASGRRLSLP